jgi:hypothetical protein
MSILFEEELTEKQLYKRIHNANRRASYYTGASPTADEIEVFFREERLPSMRSAARNRRGGKGIEFDLDEHMIKTLWIIQKGLCAYTRQPMTLFQNENGVPCKTNVSVDRIYSNLGYTYDNIILCRTDVNISKGEWSRNEHLMSARLLLENEHFLDEIIKLRDFHANIQQSSPLSEFIG